MMEKTGMDVMMLAMGKTNLQRSKIRIVFATNTSILTS
jgi:hypothetical protein